MKFKTCAIALMALSVQAFASTDTCQIVEDQARIQAERERMLILGQYGSAVLRSSAYSENAAVRCTDPNAHPLSCDVTGTLFISIAMANRAERMVAFRGADTVIMALEQNGTLSCRAESERDF